jgi:hypothetical protein
LGTQQLEATLLTLWQTFMPSSNSGVKSNAWICSGSRWIGWSPGGLFRPHIMRNLCTLRQALKESLKSAIAWKVMRSSGAGFWQELVLERYETAILRQSRVYMTENAQRMADLNALIAARRAQRSLDLTARCMPPRTCAELTNADVIGSTSRSGANSS